MRVFPESLRGDVGKGSNDGGRRRAEGGCGRRAPGAVAVMARCRGAAVEAAAAVAIVGQRRRQGRRSSGAATASGGAKGAGAGLLQRAVKAEPRGPRALLQAQSSSRGWQASDAGSRAERQ